MLSVRAIVLSLLMGAPASADDAIARYPQYEWTRERVIAVDLDRNGLTDTIRLGVSFDQVGLLIDLGSTVLPLIEIPVDGSRQFGICPGASPTVGMVPQSEAPLNALGEMPRGYEACPTCMEITVGGGECDPLHFYWDAVAGELAWWRA